MAIRRSDVNEGLSFAELVNYDNMRQEEEEEKEEEGALKQNISSFSIGLAILAVK